VNIVQRENSNKQQIIATIAHQAKPVILGQLHAFRVRLVPHN
jgi:hypothetical protein